MLLEQRPVCTHHPQQQQVGEATVICTCWVISGRHSDSCAITRAQRRVEQARLGEMLMANPEQPMMLIPPKPNRIPPGLELKP